MTTISISTQKKSVAVTFSANKADQLFLTPTIAVEKTLDRTIVRFALVRYVFNVEIAR